MVYSSPRIAVDENQRFDQIEAIGKANDLLEGSLEGWSPREPSFQPVRMSQATDGEAQEPAINRILKYLATAGGANRFVSRTASQCFDSPRTSSDREILETLPCVKKLHKPRREEKSSRNTNNPHRANHSPPPVHSGTGTAASGPLGIHGCKSGFGSPRWGCPGSAARGLPGNGEVPMHPRRLGNVRDPAPGIISTVRWTGGNHLW